VTETVEELEKELKVYEIYDKMEVRDMIKDAEIVFMDEHICNDNLKVRDKDEFLLKTEELIELNEKDKVSLK